MEIKKITDEMREKLRVPLDPKAIKPHPTKTYLSSIKNIYQVERLNDVFGVGSWSQESTVVERKDGMVVVHSKLTIPEYGVKLESFGGNDNGGENGKNFDLGDAYKGACTDALSKMCSFLEIAIDVYKGMNDPGKLQAQEKKQQQSTPPPPPANNGKTKPNGPAPLSPDDSENPERWGKVIAWLKDKNKTETDWPEIKKAYVITEASEKKLFEELNWLPF